MTVVHKTFFVCTTGVLFSGEMKQMFVFEHRRSEQLTFKTIYPAKLTGLYKEDIPCKITNLQVSKRSCVTRHSLFPLFLATRTTHRAISAHASLFFLHFSMTPPPHTQPAPNYSSNITIPFGPLQPSSTVQNHPSKPIPSSPLPQYSQITISPP